MSVANAVHDVVLLHGWGMTGDAWRELAARSPAHLRLHAPDLADHEAAHRPGSALSALAASVAAQAPERCHVVGWSLGAQVAVEWALQRPRQVESLALIAATPCFVARDDWASAMPPDVFDAFAALVRVDAAAALARFTALQAQGDEHMGRVARALRSAVRKTAPSSGDALLDGLDILRGTDLRASLPDVQQRVCLVHGERDGLVPRAAAEYLQQALPRVQLHLVQGAAHAPHISRPDTVAALIADFFDER